MKTDGLDETMQSYLQYLCLEDKKETARGYASNLKIFAQWMEDTEIDTIHDLSTSDIETYQRYLAYEYANKRTKQPIQQGTQASMLSTIKSYFRWMGEQGIIQKNVASSIKLPKKSTHLFQRDYFNQQEAIAFVQTQAATAAQYPEGSARWAGEMRDLAYICLALASGRRTAGLRSLTITDPDFERRELRCAVEKGKAGRVLPIAGWAMNILNIYLIKARPILNWRTHNEWLFVGAESERIGQTTIDQLLKRVHLATIERNPDLIDLQLKHISPHSLRVSFAKLLFSGGANIRTINELMMHEHLSTTAVYTPLELDDIRSACRLAHPRA